MINNQIVWLQGNVPPHPFFDQENKIINLIKSLKIELEQYFISGLEELIKTEGKKEIRNIWQEELLWLWILLIKASKYGVIYFLSRNEAREVLNRIDNYCYEINLITTFFNERKIPSRIINFSIFSFISNKNRKVDFSDELIPKNAISALGENHICIRKEDFLSKSKTQLLYSVEDLYDLHDFAHIITSSINKTLYGCKYFDSLIFLPKEYKKLITSPNLSDHKAIPLSDGLVFSQFLTHLFDFYYFKKKYNDQECVNHMSKSLFDYFLRQKTLYHPGTKQYLSAKKINFFQLAVLIQNKSYELPASEIEQKLFTRGGTNPELDPLLNLSLYTRIKVIAESNHWLYHEKRNTLKHRSHKQVYKLIIKYFICKCTSNDEKTFLINLLDHLEYKDFLNGKRLNLWNLISNFH